MRLVIDSSTTLAWYFEDERDAVAELALRTVVDVGAVVPALWQFEVANVLVMAQRRQRISAEYRSAVVESLGKLDIAIESPLDPEAWRACMRLAEEHRLSVYDAAYLELAARHGLHLATHDRALLMAAREAGVTTLAV